MKNIIATIGLTIFTVIGVFGQNISRSTPFGDVIQAFSRDDNGNKVTITNKLRNASGEDSMPVSDLRDVTLKITSIKVKDKDAQNIENLTISTSSTGNPKNFQILVSKKDKLDLNADPFFLPKNWESFSYTFIATVDNQPKLSDSYNMLKPALSVETQVFTVNVGSPIWVDTLKTRNELILPLQTDSASFGVIVSVSGCADGQQSSFLQSGEQSTPIRLKLAGGLVTNRDCVFNIKPGEIESVSLNLKGDICSTTGCSWRPTSSDPFIINTNDVLNQLTLTSSERKAITVITSRPGKEFKVKLDGNEVDILRQSEDETKKNEYTLTLTDVLINSIDDGAHTLEFIGESKGNIGLSGKTTYSFIKKTKPEIVEGSTIFEIQDNKLKLKYKLRGNVDNAALASPILQFRKTDGTVDNSSSVGSFQNLSCPFENGVFNCSVTLTMAPLEDDSKKKMPRIPVLLTINAKEKNRPVSPVFFVGFDLLNQEAVKNTLEGIKTRFDKNTLDASSAKKEIATEVLGVEVSNSKVEEIFNSFVKEGKSEKRNAILKTIIGIGNIALKGFGIPLTIPSNLFGN